ncbi:MAG: MarR family transcriptional regulator, partial [Frankia sp.]
MSVDGVALHRLARRLTDLARDVTTAGPWTGLTAGQLAVLEDVLHHPESVGQDIAARTGFVQSHVSASIARLRDRGRRTTRPAPGAPRPPTGTLNGPAP